MRAKATLLSKSGRFPNETSERNISIDKGSVIRPASEDTLTYNMHETSEVMT